MTDSHLPDDRLPAPPPEPEARERVVEVLTRLYADDRITSEDLEARLERVYHATTTPQLDAIVADLPAAGGAPAGLPVLAPAPARITALCSGQEQRLTGAVPRRLEVRSRLGYVELDLTHATFEPGVTEIDVRTFMGYAEIRLPAGVRVECAGRVWFGLFSLKGAKRAGGDQARVAVRVTGRASLGYAEVTVARDRALPPGGAER